MEFVGGLLSYAIPFVLVLTLVVTIHELGHFLVARAFGVEVDEFSIGFGRAIARLARPWAWTGRSAGCLWRHVRFAEDEHASSFPTQGAGGPEGRDPPPRGPARRIMYFHFKPVWQRASLIVAAGRSPTSCSPSCCSPGCCRHRRGCHRRV